MARATVAGSISAAQDKKIPQGVELPSETALDYAKAVPSWLENLRGMPEQEQAAEVRAPTTTQLNAPANVEDYAAAPTQPIVNPDAFRAEFADIPVNQGVSLTGQDNPNQQFVEEIERQSIPSFKQRQHKETGPDKWQYNSSAQNANSLPLQTNQSDGGMNTRTKDIINNKNGIGFTVQANPEGATTSTISKVLHKIGAVVEKQPEDIGFTPDRLSYKADPALMGVGALVVENDFSEIMLNEEEEVEADPLKEVMQTSKFEGYQKPFTLQVTRAKNNAKIGNKIYQEYQRLKGEASADPTTVPEKALPREEAETIGQAMKEIWARNNPDMIEIIPGNSKKDQALYRITDEGQTKLARNTYERKKFFNKTIVQPSKIPLPEGKLPGDVGATAVKDISGRVGKIRLGKEIAQAASNLSRVPHVVNNRRALIMYQTLLPVLATNSSSSWMADIYSVGQDKMKDFLGAQRGYQRKAKEAEARGELDKFIKLNGVYDPQENMAKLRFKIAQEAQSIAQNRKGANYLTYNVQSFNGRLTPQQTHFNPVTSKLVRYVTSNAVPAIVRKGSRQERNLRQIYTLLLNDNISGSPMNGADSLLPDARDRALTVATPKLKQWGERLKQVLTMTPPEYEAVSEAISKGLPFSDPAFPKVKPLALDPVNDKDLIDAIQGKGEDGPHYMDALIDFADYVDAMKKGKNFRTNINAYIDGKTNGTASNAMQMGIIPTAFRTGVLRLGTENLLDEGDVRDQLQELALSSITEGWDGNTEAFLGELNFIAREIYSDRGLNKLTTMTFGYGKEINSFALVMSDLMDELAVQDKDFADNLDRLMKKSKLSQDGVAKTLLMNKYGAALVSVISAEAINARRLMRASAIMHAAIDTPLIIKSYTGMDLVLGGYENTGDFESDNVPIFDKLQEAAGNEARNVSKVMHYDSKLTAAAARVRTDTEGNMTSTPGEFVYGGSLPAPVQSLDAATVAMSASGKSWNKLKYNSGGNPYMLTIYDAFKMDVNGYDTMLEEVNANWLKASTEWSYLKETKDATEKAIDAWNKKNKGRDPKDKLSRTERMFMDYMLSLEKNAKGEDSPKPFVNKISKMLSIPDSHVDENGFNPRLWKLANKLKVKMANVGYNVKSPPLEGEATFEQLKVFVTFLAQAQTHYDLGSAPKDADHKAIDKIIKASVLGAQFERAIEHTESNKKKLKEKIKELGVPVYQYYAH
ncbi:MAG: hypothetical protein CBC55_03955 [Gammaproteobacteria bacterium TMED95]|nr:MAG: hypothetical protein CBC55_03955 [Gammaproteobacteria bacterium TMED95]|tara:strand:+ start:4812 stop:8435 length:3624 start_codon:yes stop_codon:yes gene_type:complete